MKFRANRYLARIATTVGVQDPTRAVQIFVKDKLGKHPSLETLAHDLGVGEIVEETLHFEGGVFNLPERGLVIKLNSDSSPSRKRFTLAHEIAHLLLGTVPGLRSTCREDQMLESACDSLAAELLMPSEDAIAFIRNLGRPSPEKLKIIASKYAVSLHMAAIRVHADFHIWKCFIGMWERFPQIKTTWFVGRRRWDRVEPDSSSLDLALSSDTAVRATEVWERGPDRDPIWLDLLRIGSKGRVLGLIGFVN
jgi:hypothetical protein